MISFHYNLLRAMFFIPTELCRASSTKLMTNHRRINAGVQRGRSAGLLVSPRKVCGWLLER